MWFYPLAVREKYKLPTIPSASRLRDLCQASAEPLEVVGILVDYTRSLLRKPFFKGSNCSGQKIKVSGFPELLSESPPDMPWKPPWDRQGTTGRSSAAAGTQWGEQRTVAGFNLYSDGTVSSSSPHFFTFLLLAFAWGKWRGKNKVK